MLLGRDNLFLFIREHVEGFFTVRVYNIISLGVELGKISLRVYYFNEYATRRVDV